MPLFHVTWVYSSRLEIPKAEDGKPCNAGRLREAEGCRPYRLRYENQ
ncbi:MAG: hypothetical protein FWC50_05915 [Planctomycetaceae bacterium]|nr:hypothetical protein [Planctomycetaceae bacterium]